MGIRKYKPTSAGRRGGSVADFAECTEPRKNKPEKSLLVPRKKKGGRNNQHAVTVRFRGGGHKQRYRIIDFKRRKFGMPAEVLSIEYDPNRSCRIALVKYEDGEKSYILAPHGLKAGDKVMSGPDAEPRIGNALPFSKIPTGLTVHNVELQPGRGGQLARSAGVGVTFGNREGGVATLTMPSGEVRQVPVECLATIGSLSNPEHMNISIGKAGRMRWKGRKPHNRGTSQNPVDHPMGGGEGRTAGGRHPCSPKGVPAKGGKTRKKKKSSSKAILRRRPPGAHSNPS